MTKYELRLKALGGFLRRGFKTARQVAEAFGCTKFAAYERIKALGAAGYILEMKLRREGSTGPLAKAWKVIGME